VKSIIELHTPMKKLSRRQRKMQAKPRLTKGIINLITIGGGKAQIIQISFSK